MDEQSLWLQNKLESLMSVKTGDKLYDAIYTSQPNAHTERGM